MKPDFALLPPKTVDAGPIINKYISELDKEIERLTKGHDEYNRVNQVLVEKVEQLERQNKVLNHAVDAAGNVCESMSADIVKVEGERDKALAALRGLRVQIRSIDTSVADTLLDTNRG